SFAELICRTANKTADTHLCRSGHLRRGDFGFASMLLSWVGKRRASAEKCEFRKMRVQKNEGLIVIDQRSLRQNLLL
ncbi:hypothetical protein, partial [Microvirga sp. G4-2]|uniref:hypothetical protein n=1 Tax=Microvirga sp. G4-2 TaxID=3434467 RepID=UPI004043E84D